LPDPSPLRSPQSGRLEATARRGRSSRIIEGPLAHFVGQIERLDSKGRLKVFIDAVMRGVSVDVNETQVEPVVVRKRTKTDRRRARGLAPT
jgi:transcription termination/antitermination protein NusG